MINGINLQKIKYSKLNLSKFIIIIYMFLFQIKIINSDLNIFVFESREYRAGSIAFNSDGDMIIEYSKTNYRLFFGLKKNGEFYFENENHTKEIEIEDNNARRYESRNIFIFPDNDNTNKQYLFSIGREISYTELYDLESEQNFYIYKPYEEALGNKVFSLSFSLFELFNNNKKEYLITYVYNQEGYVQKISFSGYSLDLTKQSTDQLITVGCINSISCSFKMDSIIVLLYLDSDMNYAIRIYDFNLNLLNDNNFFILDSLDIDLTSINLDGLEIFAKCLYLKETIGAFIYYKSLETNSLKLKIGNIYQDENNVYCFTIRLVKDLNEFNFQTNILLNDFIKVNDERFVFIALGETASTTITILLIDFYNDYNNMKIRVYEPNLNNKYQVKTELTADIYNDFLIFSSTAKYIDNNSNHFSIFMIFGYPNGTNFTIDISEYFMDDNLENTNNIITKLQDFRI